MAQGEPSPSADVARGEPRSSADSGGSRQQQRSASRLVRRGARRPVGDQSAPCKVGSDSAKPQSCEIAGAILTTPLGIPRGFVPVSWHGPAAVGAAVAQQALAAATEGGRRVALHLNAFRRVPAGASHHADWDTNPSLTRVVAKRRGTLAPTRQHGPQPCNQCEQLLQRSSTGL